MALKNGIGNTYGYLTVIERAPNNKENRAMQKCKCKCGNETIVLGKHLRSGNTKSCGCIRSQDEAEIEVLLKEHNIDYIRGQIFDDLIDVLPLRFDYGIYKNNKLLCLIEFQGEQHWQSSNGYYNEKLIIHDKLKQEYCNKNKIPLYFLYYKQRVKQQVTWDDLLEIKEIREYEL